MNWSKDTVIPRHGSKQAIGLVKMPDGKVMCVHRGLALDTTLWYSFFENGAWGEDKAFPRHFSADGASLAVYKGVVHCVHRGGDADDWVYLTKFDAASGTWSADEKLAGVRSSRNPAIAVFRDEHGHEVLMCVHKGCDPDNRLWYTYYDGNGWTSDRLISADGHRTDSDPVLTVFRGTLYCLHQGRATDESIYCTTFDGSQWSPDTALPDHKTGGGSASRGSLGAVSNEHFLHLVHRGGKGDKKIWYTRFNGHTWSTDEALGPDAHNGMAVALVVNGSDLLCVHEGYDDASMWYTTAPVPSA